MGKALIWVIVALFSACVVADEDEIAALERRIAELERELEGYDECRSALTHAEYQLMLCENMED